MIGKRLNRVSRSLWIGLAILATTPCHVDADDPVDDSTLSAEHFLESARRYNLFLGSERKRLEFIERPILNWTNPERKTPAGATFIWTHKGRPCVAMCIYPNVGTFDHEFQSLATDTLIADHDKSIVWSPLADGLEFTPIELPENMSGSTPALRLRQMRHVARKFSAKVGPSPDKMKQLRMLTQPLYRYPKEDTRDVIDGAMFAFVQGTDPEVLLLVEAVQGDNDARLSWRYALARMTMVPLQVDYDNKRVWSKTWARGGPQMSYYTIKGMK